MNKYNKKKEQLNNIVFVSHGVALLLSLSYQPFAPQSYYLGLGSVKDNTTPAWEIIHLRSDLTSKQTNKLHRQTHLAGPWNSKRYRAWAEAAPVIDWFIVSGSVCGEKTEVQIHCREAEGT